MAFFSANDAKKEYSNVWAVEVTGGKPTADELARKHGFINKGQVGAEEEREENDEGRMRGN